MARNVEIKARLQDMATIRQLVAEVADGTPEILSQVDTYFNIESGRLKLREFSDASAELIYYQRPDASGPTESHYRRISIPEPQTLRELLTSALGVCAEVRKRRLVYLVGRTRVHLDEVDGLGCFLELEVVLEEEEPTDIGVAEAKRLMRMFSVSEDTLVADAYVDLLNKQGTIKDIYT